MDNIKLLIQLSESFLSVRLYTFISFLGSVSLRTGMSNKGLGVVIPDCNSRILSKNSFLETLKVFNLFCRLWDESRKCAPILSVAVFTHAQVQHVKCTADGKKQ